MESDLSMQYNNSYWILQNYSDEHLQLYTRHSMHVSLHYGIAICAVNILLSVAATFANFAILTTIWKTPSLHSSANILLGSLAVSDFAVGLVGQPLFIAFLLSGTRHVATIFYIFSSLFCSVTFLTITAIGVDRLLALRLHLRYDSLVTSFRVILVVIFIWLLSAFLSSTFLWKPHIFYSSSSPATSTLLVANFVVYLEIYRIVRRHQKKIQQQQRVASDVNIFSVKRLKRSALNTFLVFILLVVCYLPYSLYLTGLLTGVNISNMVTYTVTVTLCFSNSSLNPLLFCWRVREIRTAMEHLFNSCF